MNAKFGCNIDLKKLDFLSAEEINVILLEHNKPSNTIKYPLQWFYLKLPSHGGFGGFFSTGTYAGVSTKFVSSLKML